MNIIFGDALDHVPDNYTLLELDTFILTNGIHHTSYCVVEKVSLADFPLLETYCKLHHDMMQAYRNQNWEYCEHAIKGLTGRWNGEVDSFYHTMYTRIQALKDNPPGPGWTGAIDRSIAQGA